MPFEYDEDVIEYEKVWKKAIENLEGSLVCFNYEKNSGQQRNFKPF